MKHKVLCVFLAAVIAVLTASSAFAEIEKLGMISQARTTAEEYSKFMAEGRKFVLWEVSDNSSYNLGEFRFYFYDNFQAMLLALTAGEIDGMFLTRSVAEYIIAQNHGLKVSAVMGLPIEFGYAFGFMKDEKGEALCRKFNEALGIIKQVGRLDKLKAKYLFNPGAEEPEIVKFASFPDGETIRVAVTGDMPPLDYMRADGKAAGFNTALLAEIGEHLGCNIEILQVDSAARVPALTSGRADVIFRFGMWPSTESYVGSEHPDAASEVIVSAPYYTTDLLFKVGKK